MYAELLSYVNVLFSDQNYQHKTERTWMIHKQTNFAVYSKLIMSAFHQPSY